VSASSPAPPSADLPGPPPVRREDLLEDLHGHPVADPYRWLEGSAEDTAIRAFVAAQNAVSAAHLAAAPARSAFRDRLAALWNRPRRGAPWRRGGHWFQVRNDGGQDQDVLWTASADPADPGRLPDEAAWRVLVDPNGWSADGTASLAGVEPTDDGSRLAFARSDAGSDWMTWRVVEVASGEVLPDAVPWAKFSGAAWLPDGSGFLYGAYEPPAAGEEHAATNRGQRLHLHLLGTDPVHDPVVHERPDAPDLGFGPWVSHDGRWLVLHVWRGTDPVNRIHLAPLGGPSIGPVRRLLDDADARYEVLGVLGDELLVITDLDAPLGRILAIDLHDPARRREVVPERPDRLRTAVLVGGDRPGEPGWIVCHRLHHATSRLEVHEAGSGTRTGEVTLPGPGSVGTITGGRRDEAIHLTYESFDRPARILRHELPLGLTAPVMTPDGPADAADADDPPVVVDQLRIHHDGVAVPLFVVHRPEVEPDGTRPTVLWGYGGFDIAVTPMYRPAWRAWIDAGGVLAVACLRGGGEYGRDWHDDGRLAAKQHVFDDALAAAAWLAGTRRDEVVASALSEGADPDAVWSAPRHLGIEGRSNGGLLVGACLTQAPEAFGSAVPEVGVLDLVRFHRFTIGWGWTSDYGDPDEPGDLEVLLGYSPYHRVAAGTAYPPTLITTGDTDDRVVPAHSYKFAAALQAAQGGPAPILLRVDTSAGHGAGKPVGKLLDERADVLAFHAQHLGLTR
jgi:prolyl oligopeptidase